MQLKLFDIVQDKEDPREVMKQLSRTCTSCRLSLNHPENRGIIWRGSVDARIAIIGEAPGDKETEKGVPMIGPSGQEFERWAKLIGIDTQKDCFITNVVQCFPGDSIVRANSIEKMYKRFYNGELITVKTTSGELTGTPNHPVLTQRGWVALNQINNTDSLVNCSNSQSIVPTKPEVANRPTEFVKLFNSLSVFGTSSRVVDSGMNFHGDGKDSNVEIVTLDYRLSYARKASLFKRLSDIILKYTNNGSSNISNLCSSIGTFCKRLFSFRNSSGNRISLKSKFLSIFNRSIKHSDLLSLIVISDLDSMLNKALLHCEGSDSDTLGNGIQSFPSDVSLDKVVDISSKLFVGHVYNLQTSSNYYSINNYVVHNCQPNKIKVAEKWSQDAPDATEIKSCFPSRCLRILSAMPNLEVVVTLGWVAAGTILGEKASTRTHEAQWFTTKLLPGVPIFPLVHPSFVLRDPSIEKTKAVENCLLAFKREYVDTKKILTIVKENANASTG